ncbi:MAG: CDP-alcohol phosphatidyltransferase family protein [Pseudomonadota bacterium]
MTLYDLKPRFQALLRPLTGWLYARGVTANMVTLAAAGGSMLLGLALLVWSHAHPGLFLLVPLWLLARMALNAIDGMLAREHGQKSSLGAYLNEVSDVVSDAALFLPFAYVAPFSAPIVVVVVLLAVVSEMAGALGPMVGASRRYAGPLGKSDRALLFGALGLWVGLAGGSLPGWTMPIMTLAAVLLLVTIVNRVRRGVAEAAAMR